MADDLWFLSKRGDNGKKLPSLRHGRGKRWRGRVARAGEPPLTQLFERQADAEAWEASTRADLARGTYVDPSSGKMRLKDYAGEWLSAQTFGASTYEAVERRVRRLIVPHLGEVELTALRPSMIQAWAKGLRPLKDNTIREALHILSTILNAAVDDSRIPRNPCHAKSVKAPPMSRKKVVPWTVPQVEAIRAGMTDRYAATVDCGWGMGMRQGEVLGLAVEDIDWMNLEVHIRRQLMIVRNALVLGPPKGDKERAVPLDDEVISLRLSAHLQRFPTQKITLPWKEPDGPPVTVALLFRPMRRQNFNTYHWKKALRAAGIEPTANHGFHYLRHTYASTLLAAGVDIRALAEFLGHTDPGFTLRTYTHLTPKADDRARKAIGRALKNQNEREEKAG